MPHFPRCLHGLGKELLPVMSSGHISPALGTSNCGWWPCLCIQGFCPASRSSRAQRNGLLIRDVLSHTCKPFPRKLNSVTYLPYSQHVHGSDWWKTWLTSRITHCCCPFSNASPSNASELVEGSHLPRLIDSTYSTTGSLSHEDQAYSLLFPAPNFSYFPPHEVAEAQHPSHLNL